MRNTVTISHRNMISLPKYALEALGAKAGDQLGLALDGKTVRLIRVGGPEAAPKAREQGGREGEKKTRD